MVLTEGEGEAAPVSAAQHVEDTSGANRTLIEAIAKAHRWQAQIESGEYPSLEDLARAVGSSRRSRQAKTGCDRTYVSRLVTAQPKAKSECCARPASPRTSSRRSCEATNPTACPERGRGA